MKILIIRDAHNIFKFKRIITIVSNSKARCRQIQGRKCKLWIDIPSEFREADFGSGAAFRYPSSIQSYRDRLGPCFLTCQVFAAGFAKHRR